MTSLRTFVVCSLLLSLTACDQGGGSVPESVTPMAEPTTLVSPTQAPPAPSPLPTQAETVSTSLPSLTLAPSARLIGQHRVVSGESIFCIGRAYGVLPSAIAEANGLDSSSPLAVGVLLNIPAVQWTPIPPGLACVPQFQSPFPGLPPSPALTRPPVATFPPPSTPVTPPTPLPIDTATLTLPPAPVTASAPPVATSPPLPTPVTPPTPLPIGTATSTSPPAPVTAVHSPPPPLPPPSP